MPDFVVRRWDLAHYPGDQAPPHIHHSSDEAFCVLRGRLEVLLGETRHLLTEGDYLVVPAGTVHTFATADPEGARVLVVMTAEVDELVASLHRASSDEEREAVWARYNSSVVA
ncbi:cupin domain-containing protein [Micromonospora sp. CPCC 206061]|uniref:cupin domain-containing protein n=1 Tax=Micromonospora sp. CPCC 206061 TaxID=3122410 RepID=UPI002FF1C17C